MAMAPGGGNSQCAKKSLVLLGADSSLCQDNSTHSMLQHSYTEVNQQPPSQPHGAQVRDHLRAMDFLKARDRLQFDDNQPADNQINPLTAQRHAVIGDVNRPLTFVGEVPLRQLDAHRLSIDRLEEPRAEGAMYGDRRP